MTKDEKLIRLADKMILLILNSEILTQRIISKNIFIGEAVVVADRIINTPINQFYAEIIEELRDSEIENLTLEGEEFNRNELTSDSEWFDMVDDLVRQIKEEYLINQGNL